MSENTLVSVHCVMQEAKKLSLEIAGLKPDIASEVLVLDADAAERSSCVKMEHEILIKVHRFKLQH